MEAGVKKVEPERVPKVDPKPDPLWGAQVLRNTRNSKGFGAFWPLRGVQFWSHFRTHFEINFGTTDFGFFRNSITNVKAKWAPAHPEKARSRFYKRSEIATKVPLKSG